MIEGILGIVIISAIIGGVIGGVLGSSVNRGGAGFFLGFFLGPIGWIIVFLLPRETSNSPQTPAQTPTPKERPPRDLTSNKYKIWLGKKYEINRNELFDQFECDGELFESLDDALKYADDLEAQGRQRREAQIEKEKEKTAGYVLASEYAEQNSITVEHTITRIQNETIEGRAIDGRWYVKING